jgi:hypothetical protein
VKITEIIRRVGEVLHTERSIQFDERDHQRIEELEKGSLLRCLAHIEEQQKSILKELQAMASTIVTRDQFDAALTQAVTTITTAITDLQAKIAEGTVTTPEDFSAELAEIQKLSASALSADPNAPPAPITTTPADPGASTSVSLDPTTVSVADTVGATQVVNPGPVVNE